MKALATVCTLGVAVVALTLATLSTIAGWPETLPRHLFLYLLAGGAWLTAWIVVPRLPHGRGQLAAIVVVALALRVPAWLTPPAHSDDVWRYLWDARVQAAGHGAYDLPADAPELAPLRDDGWTKMNNRQLPTIYPPGAQLLFRLGAHSLVTWKLLLAIFDLSTLLLLMMWLQRRGGDPRRALAWGWSPLVTVEIACNAHVDGAATAFLVAGLAAWEGPRLWRMLAGALVAASASVKLLGAAVLPSLRDRRALAGFVLVAALVLAPFAGGRGPLGGSLGEYGRRWRGNDGAFAVFYAGAERLVAHTRFATKHKPASPSLARFITGRDRDEVYPDEAANLVARAISFVLFATVVALALWRRREPAVVATHAIAAFLLLSPTLHPWYVVWLVPFCALDDMLAWPLLAMLVPLGYWPLKGYLQGAGWHDPLWTRLIEHGLPLAIVCLQPLTRRRRRVT